jgi:hypothetical protein
MFQMYIANFHITRDPKFIHTDLYELLKILSEHFKNYKSKEDVHIKYIVPEGL